MYAEKTDYDDFLCMDAFRMWIKSKDDLRSYKKLWKLLIDKDMLKKDLAQKAQISPTSIAKLSKNENVNTEILQKICNALECDVCDIMEMVESNSNTEGEN